MDLFPVLLRNSMRPLLRWYRRIGSLYLLATLPFIGICIWMRQVYSGPYEQFYLSYPTGPSGADERGWQGPFGLGMYEISNYASACLLIVFLLLILQWLHAMLTSLSLSGEMHDEIAVNHASFQQARFLHALLPAIVLAIQISLLWMFHDRIGMLPKGFVSLYAANTDYPRLAAVLMTCSILTALFLLAGKRHLLPWVVTTSQILLPLLLAVIQDIPELGGGLGFYYQNPGNLDSYSSFGFWHYLFGAIIVMGLIVMLAARKMRAAWLLATLCILSGLFVAIPEANWRYKQPMIPIAKAIAPSLGHPQDEGSQWTKVFDLLRSTSHFMQARVPQDIQHYRGNTDVNAFSSVLGKAGWLWGWQKYVQLFIVLAILLFIVMPKAGRRRILRL